MFIIVDDKEYREQILPEYTKFQVSRTLVIGSDIDCSDFQGKFYIIKDLDTPNFVKELQYNGKSDKAKKKYMEWLDDEKSSMMHKFMNLIYTADMNYEPVIIVGSHKDRLRFDHLSCILKFVTGETGYQPVTIHQFLYPGE